jgi:hypothetical protein
MNWSNIINQLEDQGPIICLTGALSTDTTTLDGSPDSLSKPKRVIWAVLSVLGIVRVDAMQALYEVEWPPGISIQSLVNQFREIGAGDAYQVLMRAQTVVGLGELASAEERRARILKTRDGCNIWDELGECGHQFYKFVRQIKECCIRFALKHPGEFPAFEEGVEHYLGLAH